MRFKRAKIDALYRNVLMKRAHKSGTGGLATHNKRRPVRSQPKENEDLFCFSRGDCFIWKEKRNRMCNCKLRRPSRSSFFFSYFHQPWCLVFEKLVRSARQIFGRQYSYHDANFTWEPFFVSHTNRFEVLNGPAERSGSMATMERWLRRGRFIFSTWVSIIIGILKLSWDLVPAWLERMTHSPFVRFIRRQKYRKSQSKNNGTHVRSLPKSLCSCYEFWIVFCC